MSRERTRPTRNHEDLTCQTVLRARLDRMRVPISELNHFNQDSMFFLGLSYVELNRNQSVPQPTLAHRYNLAQAERKPD